MKRSIFIVLALFTFTSCSQPTPFTEAEKATIIEEVRQTLDNYYEDIRKSGLTAEFNYLDNSPEFFWLPPGYSVAISYDSVANILNENAPKYRSIDNAFDTLSIIPLSRELCTYTGRLTSIMTDISGAVITYELVETGVLVRRQDGWKLQSGQTSVLDNGEGEKGNGEVR